MSRITLTSAAALQFQVTSQAVVCDDTGKVLGLFVPAENSTHAPAAQSHPIPDEEFARRLQSESARPLAEIWQSLGRK